MQKKPNIKIKNSGFLKLQQIKTELDGVLIVAESEKTIPFNIKRVYYIMNLEEDNASRGFHAHKTLDQYIFCIKGSCVLELDDGSITQKVILDDPCTGVRLGPGVWHVMSKLSSDCVLIVFASDYYDEDDYIRDYDSFLIHKNRDTN